MREIARQVLDRLFARIEREAYLGRSKFDALASPLVRAACLGIPFLRLAATVAVSRAPCDLRPLLGVPRRFSTKAAAHLARAYLARGSPGDAEKARGLLRRLRGCARKTPHGLGFGYEHPWQGRYFFVPAFAPNAYVSCLAAEAFCDAGDVETANRIGDFLEHDLPRLLDEAPDGRLALAYVASPVRGRVVNVNALAAGVFARLGRIETAARLVRYVLSCQRPDGAWHYAESPGTTPVDNYHTGFILDGLLSYLRASDDAAARAAWEKGLAFYRAHLFDEDGAPRWREDRPFPRDVQGAAQGVLTFVRAGDLETADRILAWTLAHLWDEPRAAFAYRRGRFFTNRTVLLGWTDDLIALTLAERARRPER